MRVKKGYATRRGKIAVEDAAVYVRDLAQRLEARGRLGATRFCTIIFSTTGTIPIRVIAFMGSGIRMPPCDVPKKILT